MPLVPRATSSAAPVTRGVSGVPDCHVNVVANAPVAEQRARRAAVAQPGAVRAERQLDAQVGRELMPAIEAREPPLGLEVLVVLRDGRAAAADATRRCRATCASV